MGEIINIVFEHDFFRNVIVSSFSFIITTIFAFFVWLLKNGYDNYILETKLLRKTEISLIRDDASITANQEYLEEWIACLKENRPYTCAFRSYSSDNLNFSEISNQEVLNKLNKLTYQLGGLEKDLENTFRNYTILTEKLLDGDHVDLWTKFNETTIDQLSTFQKNFIDAKEDIIKSLALLRVYGNQKSFSIFKLIRYLNTPLLPRITTNSINIEKASILAKTQTRQK